MKRSIFFLFFTISLCACNTTKNQDPGPDPDGGKYIPERLLVLLQDRIQPVELEKAIPNYGLKAMGQTSRSQNLWMFAFDSQKIKGAELVQLLQDSPMVISAEQAPLQESPQ